jgi:hypothetical protein
MRALNVPSAPRCLIMRFSLDRARHRQIQVVNRPRSLTGGVRPRVQPEKTCHSESTAGLPSRADLLADGPDRRSVPIPDMTPLRLVATPEDDRPLSPPWRAGHQRVVSFRVEPNIVPTAVLGPSQQVLRLGGWVPQWLLPPYCYPPPYYFRYLGRLGAKCSLPGGWSHQ